MNKSATKTFLIAQEQDYYTKSILEISSCGLIILDKLYLHVFGFVIHI